MNKLYAVGVASGIAAADPGCSEGPLVLQASVLLQTQLERANIVLDWAAMLHAASGTTTMAQVADMARRLAQITRVLTLEHRCFTVFGGDHSCAVGTWSGVADAIRSKGALGLIWIDAHLDSHTPETSESGNIHGMPAASLLGYGDPALTHLFGWAPKIKPEHLCFVGVRDYEPAERQLIERLGVRVYYMDEVRTRGLQVVLQEARDRVMQGTAGFGISLDIDAIEPQEAPGTGVLVANGISTQTLREAFTLFQEQSALLGMEIAEFDPHRDKENKTEKLIGEILVCLNKQNMQST